MRKFFQNNPPRERKSGVNGFQTILTGVFIEQRQRRNPEKSVENVGGVSGAVGDPALNVLALQNEVF